MQPGTLTSPPALRYDGRSKIAAALCVLALFTGGLGWLLGIAGVFLLRRSMFRSRVKWTLAAIALAPKILFLAVRSVSAPSGVSFTVEPWTVATASSLWAWSILLGGLGLMLLLAPRKATAAPNAVRPGSFPSIMLKIAGVAAIAAAVAMLLGLTDDFQRIERLADGRWALKHAVRGAVATFTRDELVSIEAVQTRTSRSGSRYHVRVALAGGRTFSAATTSTDVLQELPKFATTAGILPGKARILRTNGRNWMNGISGIRLEDCLGKYEYVDPQLGERSTIEFWVDKGGLAGRETVLNGGRKYVQNLRKIVIGDTGEVEFQEDPYAEASQSSESTSISLRWSAQGERGRFTKDGLEIGVKKYRKL